MIDLIKDLTEYGAIGLIALVSLAWSWRMYKDKERVQEQHRQTVEALRERYITKAETWMAKYHDIAKANTKVLEAIERRYGR